MALEEKSLAPTYEETVLFVVFQSVAFQEMLLKLESYFTFGSIKTPRHNKSQELISRRIDQVAYVSAKRLGSPLNRRWPAIARPQ